VTFIRGRQIGWTEKKQQVPPPRFASAGMTILRGVVTKNITNLNRKSGGAECGWTCGFSSGFRQTLDATTQCTQGCVDQNGQIHKEGTVLDVTQVVVDVLVDGKGPIGAQLP
jgi:hypothetical protein